MGPGRAKHQLINLWLKDSLENSSCTAGETKVSVIPLSVEPVSPLFPKIIVRLQVYTNTIKIVNINCKVLSKKSTSISDKMTVVTRLQSRPVHQFCHFWNTFFVGLVQWRRCRRVLKLIWANKEFTYLSGRSKEGIW